MTGVLTGPLRRQRRHGRHGPLLQLLLLLLTAAGRGRRGGRAAAAVAVAVAAALVEVEGGDLAGDVGHRVRRGRRAGVESHAADLYVI